MGRAGSGPEFHVNGSGRVTSLHLWVGLGTFCTECTKKLYVRYKNWDDVRMCHAEVGAQYSMERFW